MLEVIVLAAGRGTRMRSSLPKVLHPLAGKPLINHVLDTARRIAAQNIHVVVGHGAEIVCQEIAASDVTTYVQSEQLGTGHATLAAAPHCQPDSTVIVLFGDVPMLSEETLSRVIAAAKSGPALLAASMKDPNGYGRVIRDGAGAFVRVVEQKDAGPEALSVKEVNTGVLAANARALTNWLSRVTNDNAQGEYYLPDVLGLAVEDGCSVEVVVTEDEIETQGVNDRVQLEALERSLQLRKAEELMASGVTLSDKHRFDLRGQLDCAEDVSIDVNVVIEGEVRIGKGSVIEPNCVLKDCTIGDGAVIRAFSHVEGASVGAECQVGPYARLRPGADLSAKAKVGNFVEVKNSRFGEGAKANHLAYVGDTDVGAGSNIGAGTITCNYDGVNKHRTQLGDNVFIGSNSTLVAPLSVEDNGFVAAGSTVTSNVGEGELAVGRAKQRNIQGWKRPTKRSGK